MAQLGKLERIENIRTVWPDEARNFTPWLATAENLSALAEAIGFGSDGFELEAVERGVGAFSADIVCRSTIPDGGHVLIENMFGRSDHDHLGKILTYASGVRAKTVVLIAETIREEHRAALDWLNTISDDDHAFFACEIELWRIGNSQPAPRFNLVVKPNDWSRQTFRKAVESGEISDLKLAYQAYWEAFNIHLAGQQSRIRPRKPLPQHWLDFAIGRSGFTLAASLNTAKNQIRVELFLSGVNAKARYQQLLLLRREIDSDFGVELIWDDLPDRLGARISITKTATPIDRSDWPDQHQWLTDMFMAFDRVFRTRIATLEGSINEMIQQGNVP
jgi:hypothetical protein